MTEDSRLHEMLYTLTIHDALAGLRAGDFSSVELTRALLDRIERVDGTVKAYLHLTPDLALERAADADRLRGQGEDRPLLGVPLAIKDVLATSGVQTTCGSRILEGFVPPYTATAVSKLNAAGMVMLGKTNTDEFAMGSSTENSGYFTTHNPWDLDRVPGGSSGGSAAAVAADEARQVALRPKLTREFLSTLMQAARTYGWEGDYTEIVEFAKYCHRLAGVDVLDLKPHDEVEMDRLAHRRRSGDRVRDR